MHAVHGGTYEAGHDVPGTVYRVVRHLATGGMGTVYEVEDTTVEKRYVLKTLHPQLLAREDLARRMKEEAKTLAKLHHPNIVDVVTAGITQDSLRVPYYVMERLNGQNLRFVLDKKGALDAVHALRVAIDVLDALQHAHEHGIVHRDVKPENIFLHRNASGTTTTKLLDFGIMRLIDQRTNVTQGGFVGTLRYASPEQIMGEAISGVSDVYSLALVLYEMLCGRGPFDEISESHAVGFAHVHREPPPLSRFVRLSAELESAVLGALAKKPAERPKDALTFATELRRLLAASAGPSAAFSPRPPLVSADFGGLGGGGEAGASAPPVTANAQATGPMAAEAATRPPDRGILLPVALASIFAVTVLGGAALYVTKPWAAAAPPPAALPTTAATVQGTAQPTASVAAAPVLPPMATTAPTPAAPAASAEPTSVPSTRAAPPPAAATAAARAAAGRAPAPAAAAPPALATAKAAAAPAPRLAPRPELRAEPKPEAKSDANTGGKPPAPATKPANQPPKPEDVQFE